MSDLFSISLGKAQFLNLYFFARMNKTMKSARVWLITTPSVMFVSFVLLESSLHKLLTVKVNQWTTSQHFSDKSKHIFKTSRSFVSFLRMTFLNKWEKTRLVYSLHSLCQNQYVSPKDDTYLIFSRFPQQCYPLVNLTFLKLVFYFLISFYAKATHA